MGSLGTGELLVIAIVALVVFGPKRLPELARKAGELLEKARSATRSITESIDSDYGELAAPLQTLKSEYDATVDEIKNVGSTVAGMGTTLPGEEVDGGRVDGSQSTVDGTEEEADDEEAVSGDSDTVDRLPSTDDPNGSSGSDTVDGRRSTVDGTEQEAVGADSDSDTVDRLPSTDDPSTDDPDSVDRLPSTPDSDSDTVDRLPSTDDPGSS